MIPDFTVSDLNVATAPRSAVVLPWPENQECSRQFQAWLVAGGYSRSGVQGNYASAARWALQRLAQPYWALEPEEIITPARVSLEQRADLSALTKRGYAKGLKKLLEFLLFQQGREVPSPDGWALPAALDEWPGWLSQPLSHYLRVQQRQWSERTVREHTHGLFHVLGGLCRYFTLRYQWSTWSELSLRWIDDYIDTGLRQGLAASTINGRLMAWQSLCRFLLEEGYSVPVTLTRLELLEIPHRLPRPLSNDQVRRLERCIRSAIADAPTDWRRQQATMDLAWFYLLWHCGLRLSEIRYVTRPDLDLEDRKLFVRAGKGRKDRVVYLSDTAVQALRQHLATRADADRAYLFTRHRRVLLRGLLERRLAIYGRQVGVAVTPHRLRHTFASQMLAAGMPVTSLQRYLGHENIDTTMIYAAVSDPMLEQDYYRGIVTIDPASAPMASASSAEPSRQAELRRWMVQLKQPRLTAARRKKILEQMQRLLDEPSRSKATDT